MIPVEYNLGDGFVTGCYNSYFLLGVNKVKTCVQEPSTEICHFTCNTQKYKNLFRQARSNRFLYVGYHYIVVDILFEKFTLKLQR